MNDALAAQPPLRAVPMSLFPTLVSLPDALAYAESRLPVTDKNELMQILMIYHNTLLKEFPWPSP